MKGVKSGTRDQSGLVSDPQVFHRVEGVRKDYSLL